jgi:hypothetical protein
MYRMGFFKKMMFWEKRRGNITYNGRYKRLHRGATQM